jgi:hypothetical protein
VRLGQLGVILGQALERRDRLVAVALVGFDDAADEARLRILRIAATRVDLGAGLCIASRTSRIGGLDRQARGGAGWVIDRLGGGALGRAALGDDSGDGEPGADID